MASDLTSKPMSMGPLLSEITSNPGGCCVHVSQRFYYAVGNTLAVDLTEGCRIPDEASFLLLGCGDIRNILHTVSEIGKTSEGRRRKSLHFHLNDLDTCILARDAILLSLVNSIDPSNVEELQLLWSVWYNFALTESEFDRLQNLLMDLIENNSLFGVSFGSSGLGSVIRKIWKTWLTCGMDINAVRKERQLLIQKRESIGQSEPQNWKAAHESLTVKLGCNKEAWRDEVNAYIASGSIREDSNHRGIKKPPCSNLDLPGARLNSTFICPDTKKWRVHPGATPFDACEPHSWNKDRTLTSQCMAKLRISVRQWQALQKENGMIKVTLWAGDGLELMDSLPVDVKFDFIDTSNLADYLGLLNVLLWTTPRLNSQGVLTTQSLLWKGKFKTVKEYIHTHLGFQVAMFPTVLGLRLTEDLELGISKKLILGVCPNSSAVTLHWLQTSGESTKLSLNGTDGVSQAVISAAKECLSLGDRMTDTSGSHSRSPLTLIRLVQRLAPKIQGGEKSILDLIRGLALSSVIVDGGLEYEPLAQSWQTLLIANGIVNQDDVILKVIVPVRVSAWGRYEIDHNSGGVSVGMATQACIVENPVDVHNLARQEMNVDTLSTVAPVHVHSNVSYDINTSTATFYMRELDWDKLPEAAMFVFMSRSKDFGGSLFEPVSHFRTVAKVRAVSYSTTTPGYVESDSEEVAKEVPKVILYEEEHSYSLVWSPGPQTGGGQFKSEFTPAENPCTVTMRFQNPKCANVLASVACTLPSPVVPGASKFKIQRKACKIKATMPKQMDWFVGCLALPCRHVGIDGAPLYADRPASERDALQTCLGMMFVAPEERQLKMSGKETTDASYNLRETLQIIIAYAMTQPQIKGYFIMLKGRHVDQNRRMFGLSKQDVIIFVHDLHSMNSLPTVGLDWVDFERVHVLIEAGQLSRELVDQVIETHFVAGKHDIHKMSITIQEATLLKRLLKYNSRRVLQDPTAVTHGWMLAGFLQPVYSLEGFDLAGEANKLEQNDELLAAKDVATMLGLLEAPLQTQPNETTCSFCARVASDLLRCTRCKSTCYCNSTCQKADWRRHKSQCRGSTHVGRGGGHEVTRAKPAKAAGLGKHRVRWLDEGRVGASSASAPGAAAAAASAVSRLGDRRLHTCESCGRDGKDLRKCARCTAAYYCDADCQKKHWPQHKPHCKK